MSVSVNNVMSWVGQSDTMSCWAASATMMLGWRDQVCYANDQDVRQAYGDMGGDGADVEECLRLALGQGMRVEAEMCRTPEGWEQLLQKGPVMVGIPGHFVVVSAIEGDGSEEGPTSTCWIRAPARSGSCTPTSSAPTSSTPTPVTTSCSTDRRPGRVIVRPFE